ncbi:N-acetylglucosamine-6-phosphate deacetylase [Flavonifractor sp. An112]|uniref:N-acetylglucosamine-6-phosphate deacetylase n=1 Tax=Flavonifractor sp. An112 TaxID=1965544 RepID=UPI00174CCAFF|nr:N-acetylglucosamine-6-phosphate deacetylase [Flavonifractor sp. An112]HIZ93695.1 N-acetylglucosamine-6-phosphate deacetylase [Candidatus Flavonifractor avicola]
MKRTLFTNGKVYVDGQFQDTDLLVQDGRVAGFSGKADEVVDLGGKLLVPGFLDLHTHGGDGVDVNAATAGDLAKIGRFFAKNGTTGWLCSILTDTPEQTLWCIDQAKAAMAAPITGAQLMGIHLEGPFLCSAYKGAMPEHLLRKGDPALFRQYQQAAEGAVRYITVSPEVEGVVDMIREISGHTTVAIGHSGADYETSCAAIDAGAACCTHTFNAMGLFHQHRPGIMGAVLERPVCCEAICDGRHLHPGSVRMLLACKGWDKVVAVTDSIQAAGLPDGHYKLGVNDVVVEDGDAKLASNGVRAGSTLTTGQALKNLVKFTGESVEKVLPLLTANPARLIGMDHRKGSIAPGKDADLVVLDQDLNVTATYVAGVNVYAGEN